MDEENNPDNSPHDIIISADLMINVGIECHFNSGKIMWDDQEVPMKIPQQLSDTTACSK